MVFVVIFQDLSAGGVTECGFCGIRTVVIFEDPACGWFDRKRNRTLIVTHMKGERAGGSNRTETRCVIMMSAASMRRPYYQPNNFDGIVTALKIIYI